ncbi:Hypothetical protein RY67_338 [Bifidobacterium longum subsp. infantis]|uniref:Uncharacterized protein n=1 Tax=Bifidobacterium longum subsp. infantis TaxID=1682 RepID=A0A0M3T5L1_BIFLI|nr:Hypothetical protein RY67_338 [Bifidobacterium longum subsp. infantis]
MRNIEQILTLFGDLVLFVHFLPKITCLQTTQSDNFFKSSFQKYSFSPHF